MSIHDREQVLAFRLSSHHRTHRLPGTGLLEAAAVCGLQETPPGSAALALQARFSGSPHGPSHERSGQGRLDRRRAAWQAPHV